jgi:hypothetical protein
MKAWSIIAERLNVLPCMRAKLNTPIDASDCVQILIAINQVQQESIKKESRGVTSEQKTTQTG